MSTVITWSAELFEWKPYNAPKDDGSHDDSDSSYSDSSYSEPFDASDKVNTREELERIHKQVEESSKDDTGIIENTKNFMDFIGDVKEDGLVYAIWGKPFPQLFGEFLTECLKVIAKFIVGNADLFFLFPALLSIIGTFTFGKNRFTKWILPLLFAYVTSIVFYNALSN